MKNQTESSVSSAIIKASSRSAKQDSVTKITKPTPMIEQYIEIKAGYPDSLLFYRMGDFYELFFEDAIEAAQALKITLTKRGKHLGEDIPMCGVPVQACNEYLQKLISLGYRVALCEQVEAPEEAKKRGAKAVVQRRVVRLITPATLTEPQLLDPNQANHLVTLGYDEKTKNYALAWIDISTGIFGVGPTKFEHLLTDIMRFEPKEVIISENFFDNINYRHLLKTLGRLAIREIASYFDANLAPTRIKAFYEVASLESFAPFTRAELSAISSAIAYIEKTQIDTKPLLMRPNRTIEDDRLFIDNATRTNLELLFSLSGKRDGSLLKTINRTVTGAGARLLQERLMAPLMAPVKINQRLDSVSFFYKSDKICETIGLFLRSCPDLPRALSRLALNRSMPQDLKNIEKGLELLTRILPFFKSQLLPQELSDALAILKETPIPLWQHLKRALADEMPINKRDGGFIRPHYHQELDDMRRLRDEARAIIANMQQNYCNQTSIKNLKIKYNNILGYYIEVTALQAEKVQKDPTLKEKFIHRQTMMNNVRFVTEELKEIEHKISHAAERVLEIELEIFDNLSREVITYSKFIQKAAAALALLDVSSSLALLAREQNYCRPIVDDSLNFLIEKGRHPVVEQALRAKSEKPFIANNCDLSPHSAANKNQSKEDNKGALWLLTGPNMGGKSTFLRQNALIAIMAQMGSFVPAKHAHIGVIDRLFSRVGASDDLAQGHSTFMVEMIETASILNQASPKSLVILDEIGRGTATFDGLAIAFSCVEHLHEQNSCRTIFATHFHELTKLEQKLSRLQNVTMQVKEWNQDVIFLHTITKGAADRSYGIQVAKLAGLPQKVILRAQEILVKLESDSQNENNNLIVALDSPNSKKIHSAHTIKDTELYRELAALNPDELSPKEALSTLYKLKNSLKTL